MIKRFIEKLKYGFHGRVRTLRIWRLVFQWQLHFWLRPSKAEFKRAKEVADELAREQEEWEAHRQELDDIRY